jgi:hypothetical protein
MASNSASYNPNPHSMITVNGVLMSVADYQDLLENGR